MELRRRSLTHPRQPPCKTPTLSVALLVTLAGCTSTDVDAGVCRAPRNSLIADFDTGPEVDLGGSHEGGAFAYPETLASNIMAGELRVGGTVDDYAGFGFWLDPCLDASAYQGLEFRLSGMPVFQTSLDLQLSVATRENDPRPPATELGTCTPADPENPFADCQSAVAPLILPDGPEVIRIPFAAISGGVPHPDVDPSQIVSIAFWLPWFEGASSYEVDVRLDDVRLYGE